MMRTYGGYVRNYGLTLVRARKIDVGWPNYEIVADRARTGAECVDALAL